MHTRIRLPKPPPQHTHHNTVHPYLQHVELPVEFKVVRLVLQRFK